METKSLVQANVNVIRIVNLKVGDVFKKVRDDSYGNEVVYGVVVDLMNDGVNTFIEVIEYAKNYDEMKGEIKVYSGKKDVAVFPTKVDEVREHFGSVIKSLEEGVEKDKKKLSDDIKAIEKAKEFMTGELSKKLSEIEFEEMSQKKFDETNKLKERVEE